MFENLKTILTNQLLRVAELNGSRTPGAQVPLPNRGIDPLADNEGRIYVRVAGPNGNIDDNIVILRADKTTPPLEPYVEFFEVAPLGSFGTNFIFGFNVNTAIRYVQVFSNVAAQPVANDIPLISVLVPPNSNYSINLGQFASVGATNPNSLWIVSSTTGNIYTPSGTEDLWINIVGQTAAP